jgi:hypothetical protein
MILVAAHHVAPAHHETSKRDSPNETKVKEKQNENISDSNSNLDKSMTHHNQTKELITWFLRLRDHYMPLQRFTMGRMLGIAKVVAVP